jgi:hypothetical protein
MMVGAAADLLLNYRLHRRHGTTRAGWLAACRRFADFLVGRQNPDGTWYRAYTPDGAPIRSGPWFGDDEGAARSATCVPVPFLLDLYQRSPDPAYLDGAERAADLAAHSSAELLSHPGDLMGFADVGMQPEGIAFCDQGVDEGLIAKGDIWGGLGWIYTAGTFGLGRYLREKRRGEGPSSATG